LKREAIKKYFILNGELIETEKEEIFHLINKPPIYEVIRVINGVPLFLEEHLERMRSSSDITGYKIYRSDEDIKEDIRRLIIENNISNLNIKLLCTDVEGKGQLFLAYFIESYYPDEIVYNNGIHTILYYFERENPNAKILNVSFKEDVNAKIKEEDAFEALLVNRNGYITEGSRSNMFFVTDSLVYTSPAGEVLLGVTRKYIMKVCRDLDIEVVEENINIEDLEKLNGAFMSGTSVNVLPISTIDHHEYDSVNNSIVKKIGEGYLNEMKNYIKKNMDKWK